MLEIAEPDHPRLAVRGAEIVAHRVALDACRAAGYRLIDEVYIRDRGETTIDTIVPVYAPSHDQNDPDAYIRTVKRLVARWRGY